MVKGRALNKNSIAFASKNLENTEAMYSTNELEFLKQLCGRAKILNRKFWVKDSKSQ